MKTLIQRAKEKAHKAWGSRAMGIGAGLLLLLVLALVATSVVLAFIAPKNNNEQAAPEPGEVSRPADIPESATSSEDSSPAAEGKCNVPVKGTSLRPKVPTDLRWTAAKGLSWPVSDSTGPTQTDDNHPVCFARSPLGAGLFATSFNYEGWLSKDFPQFAANYAADTAARAEILSAPSSPGAAEDALDRGWSAAGFSVEYFADERAEVTLVLRDQTSTTGYIGLPLSLVWSNDDWKIDSAYLKKTVKPTNPSKGDFVEWGK